MARTLDEQLLDDQQALATGDPRGVLRALATAGAQVRESVARWHDLTDVDSRLGAEDRPRAVVVAALGGGAVVGDLLTCLAGEGSPVPVTVRRGTPLPGWVGPLDAVVAVSLSGRAPGPLALAAEAARRGCRLVTVGAADSPLAQVCHQARGLHVDIGRDRSLTRTALWSLLVPVLLAADTWGLVRVPGAELERTADVLDEVAATCRPSSESFLNPAKELALQVGASVPVVLGDSPLTGVAATRCAAMLASTARVPALPGVLPDDASAVVSTFGGPMASGGDDGLDDVFADPFLDGPSGPRLRLVLLRDGVEASGAIPDEEGGEAPPPIDAADGARIRLADAVRDTAERSGVQVTELHAPSGPPLARWADLVQRSDFAATYLALGLGLDPSTSPQRADLRERTSG